VSVVCGQVEVSATSWSLVQRSPTDCGVSEVCEHEAWKNEEAQAHIGLSSHRKKKLRPDVQDLDSCFIIFIMDSNKGLPCGSLTRLEGFLS
jgi:hypothetical protein